LAEGQEVLPVSQTLTLPDELIAKLSLGAAQRGLTLEALLAFVSDLVVLPDQPTERDRERSRHIERLLARFRAGALTEQDRVALDELIDTDYEEAIRRADRLIAAKQARQKTPTTPVPHPRSSPRPGNRSRE
jgi:hypothetical protein